jgi:tripartite-type tricarboxylate transporter receptor subunit TctC
MVPFTGAAPGANALVGGQIDYMLNGISDVGQQVQAGTIKAYAIAAAERHPALPNVPTTLEAGLPEFLALPWIARNRPIKRAVRQPSRDVFSWRGASWRHSGGWRCD